MDSRIKDCNFHIVIKCIDITVSKELTFHEYYKHLKNSNYTKIRIILNTKYVNNSHHPNQPNISKHHLKQPKYLNTLTHVKPSISQTPQASFVSQKAQILQRSIMINVNIPEILKFEIKYFFK